MKAYWQAHIVFKQLLTHILHNMGTNPVQAVTGYEVTYTTQQKDKNHEKRGVTQILSIFVVNTFINKIR